MNKMKLNIAGEIVPILFDGKRVTSPDFPDIEMEFVSRCGKKITQKALVEICKIKTQQ
jgi:hypothetical protein